MVQRNAASVFPDPVGAWISVWSPEEIDAQPADWASVGAENDASNHARVAGMNCGGNMTPSVSDRQDKKPVGGLL